VRFLAAGLAAAALAVAPMAEAKVILVQPEVKNFVSDSPAANKAVEKKAAAPKAEKKAYKEESGSSGAGFEAFRPLALPLALVGVAGAGAVAVKVDPEFADLFDSTWSAKDSNATGAGYEVAPGLKDGPFYGGSAAGGAAVKVRACMACLSGWAGAAAASGAAACAVQKHPPYPCCPCLASRIIRPPAEELRHPRWPEEGSWHRHHEEGTHPCVWKARCQGRPQPPQQPVQARLSLSSAGTPAVLWRRGLTPLPRVPSLPPVPRPAWRARVFVAAALILVLLPLSSHQEKKIPFVWPFLL
jgi:hypothetical protein